MKIKQTFQSEDKNLATKRVKIGKSEDVSAATLKCFNCKIDQGAVICGRLIIEKAQGLKKDMGSEETGCLQGWLTSLKKMHNI